MKLFTTRDISIVKKYVKKEFIKILSDHIYLKDYIFSKEVRIGSYSDRGPPPHSAIVALQSMKRDYRTEPLYRQRIPYVVIYGEPGSRLCDLVISPISFIKNPSFRINGIYYITHQIIPSLSRLFNLIGCDVMSWYNELKRTNKSTFYQISDNDYYNHIKGINNIYSTNDIHGTIDQYYENTTCCLCDCETINNICDNCLNNKQETLFMMKMKCRNLEKEYYNCLNKCNNCCYYKMINFECISLECENMYNKINLWRKIKRNQCILIDLEKSIDIEDL